MALIDLIKNLPDIGKQTIKLIIKPRTYIIDKEKNPSRYVSTEKTFLWLIAFSLLLLKMYSTVYKPIGEEVIDASPFKMCSDTTKYVSPPEEQKTKPSIENILWWSPGFGVGLNFPDPCKPSNLPQYCVFHVGGLYALIKDLKPEQFSQTGFSAFFLIILTIVFTFCIYPLPQLSYAIVKKTFSKKHSLSSIKHIPQSLKAHTGSTVPHPVPFALYHLWRLPLSVFCAALQAVDLVVHNRCPLAGDG